MASRLFQKFSDGISRSTSLLRTHETLGKVFHGPAVGLPGMKVLSKRGIHGNEPKHTQSESYVSVEEHERIIYDLKKHHEKIMSELNTKMDESIMEHQNCMQEMIVKCRYELKKEADENNLKHVLDQVNIRNEFKVLEEKFKAHKLTTEEEISNTHLSKLKIAGALFGGACTATVVYYVFVNLILKCGTGTDGASST